MPDLLHTTTLGDVLIRTATLADAEGYRALRLEALLKHPTSFGQSYETILAQPQRYWLERLEPNPNQRLYFAEHGETLVGMTGIVRSDAPKFQHSATIWGVYVKEAWRGQHIAEALIRACLEWAKTGGVVVVKLAVVAGNQPAIRCYERLGFQTYGIEPQVIFYAGKYYDEYLMSRPVEN